MFPLEPCYPITLGYAHFNIAEVQGKYLKTNYMKMIEVIKEEVNKPLKGS